MDPYRRQLTNPKAHKLQMVLELFRLIEQEMPAQVITTFLYVAAHDNCHKTALEEDLGLTAASGSRNTDRLSKYHRLNKPGLDLITKEVDPQNRRRQILRLTPKGELLLKQIEEILYD